MNMEGIKQSIAEDHGFSDWLLGFYKILQPPIFSTTLIFRVVIARAWEKAVRVGLCVPPCGRLLFWSNIAHNKMI